MLSFSRLSTDARVQRVCQALASQGTSVVLIGRSPAPEADYASIRTVGPFARKPIRALQLGVTLIPGVVRPLGRVTYWAAPERWRMQDLARNHPAQLIYCNDWDTLPIGAQLKRRHGAKLIYDSHELATEEHAGSPAWRLLGRPAVQDIESHFISQADGVVTVSEGIADALRDLYGIRRPTVVRNVPRYQQVRRREPSTERRILFHGNVLPERGLEALIDSIPLWTFAGVLIIRGPGHRSYLDSLERRCAQRGVSDRVRFQPAVLPADLVPLAAESDIGFIGQIPDTPEYDYALPNKVFEYLMAGLAVLSCPPRQAVSELLSSYGAGVSVSKDSGSLAAALNGLDNRELAAMQRSALNAATELNFEHESRRLIELIARAGEADSHEPHEEPS